MLDFYASYPELIPSHHSKSIANQLKVISESLLLGLAIGFGINVKIKHIYPQILKLSFIEKFGLRFLLLTAPIGIMYELVTKRKREELNSEIDSVHQKLRKLGREGSLIHHYAM